MEIAILSEIVIIFALAIVVVLLCHRVKLPSIVGFLITGVLAGPHGLGLLKNVSDVETVATMGIVLLLFTVGMEFSFKKIIEYKRYFLVGGGLQVGMTVLAGFAIAFFLGRPFGESVFLGFLLSLSSTAIVLRLLDEKSEADAPHGRVIVGMMIFQDIIAIPMMLVIPVLSGGGGAVGWDFLLDLGKGILILAIVLFGAQLVIPRLMFAIAKTRSRELFLLTVFTICFSVAWLTSSVGLSLSLGAFLAGLIVSDSEYRHEAIGDILPFQDVFTSFFFVSIGMLLDLAFVVQQPLLVIGAAIGVLLVKGGIAGATTLVLGMPLRTAVFAGAALSQVGEFSFVLAKAGEEAGLGSDYHYQLFLAVSLLTMAVTPTLISLSPRLANLAMRLPFPQKLKAGMLASRPPRAHSDHVVIVGYGPSGQTLARSLKEAKIPYVILEMNPETVRAEKAKGESIYFGDATHEAILHHIHLEGARAVAVLINDFPATIRIVETVRKIAPQIYTLVRTRYVRQVKTLFQCGADDVVPDEFGGSIEIFVKVLRSIRVEEGLIKKLAEDVRIENDLVLRNVNSAKSSTGDFEFGIEHLVVEKMKVHESSPLVGKTLSETEFQRIYDVSVLAIRRLGEKITKVDGATLIHAEDEFLLVGEQENLRGVSSLFVSTDHPALKE